MSNTRRRLLASALFLAVAGGGVGMALPAHAAAESALAVSDAPEAAAAAALLSSTAWETTGAVDQDGAPVALSDARAVNFVGNANFKADGTFTMFNLDDSRPGSTERPGGGSEDGSEDGDEDADENVTSGKQPSANGGALATTGGEMSFAALSGGAFC